MEESGKLGEILFWMRAGGAGAFIPDHFHFVQETVNHSKLHNGVSGQGHIQNFPFWELTHNDADAFRKSKIC